MAKIEIELTPKEIETFKEVLENFVSNLRMEITDTDKQEYREILKAKKNLIARIIQQLEAEISA
jgi:hypothetical protein